MWSPVTRSPPLEATATPRKMLPPPMTTPTSTPRPLRLGDVGGDAVDDGDVDAETLGAHQGLAGGLEQDTLVDRLRRHGSLSWLTREALPRQSNHGAAIHEGHRVVTRRPSAYFDETTV